MVFLNVSRQVTARIYTLDGRLVREILPGTFADHGRTVNQGESNSLTWGLVNQQGEAVASGVYPFILRDPEGHGARGKIAVIR